MVSLSNGVYGIPEQELLEMVTALRSRGYKLFCNALMTSDIHDEILSGSSFTFFAPTDSALFALDMATTATYYVQTLRFHVVPGRFSMLFLRSLPSISSFSTLLPHKHIFISHERMPNSNLIAVNNVEIVFPGLFYSRDIAVHGLSSILILRHNGSAHAQPQSTAKSAANDTNTLSPSMNVADLDRISPIANSPDDRLPVDYSSYEESPDTHPYWNLYSAPAPEQSKSEFGETPVEICGGHEKVLKTDNGIHGEATAATEEILEETQWPLDGKTEYPAMTSDKGL
ncbi:uncharacterized protein LOC122084946 [Macadamia integrifolia]|uniref:uncharacterized protein LOC122084946 n=1 Tax=Macadamia integrifolia TaxID=60698 RepID=UPI001C4FD409|nr:uncharacterized protein LOC122084946 [Macadamia integrifolia]